jgi:hypothetical protein
MSASSLDSVREELTRRVEVALASSPFSTIPMWYPNRPFIQPSNSIWVMMHIVGGEGIQANLGETPVERHVGMLQFSIMMPEDKGTKQGNDLADFLGKKFSRAQFYTDNNNRLTFKVPQYNQVDTVSKGFITNNVRITFRRNEITF